MAHAEATRWQPRARYADTKRDRQTGRQWVAHKAEAVGKSCGNWAPPAGFWHAADAQTHNLTQAHTHTHVHTLTATETEIHASADNTHVNINVKYTKGRLQRCRGLEMDPSWIVVTRAIVYAQAGSRGAGVCVCVEASILD